jgi:D-tyrosyl-tRNA(Tyr) deacylase
MDDMIGKKPDFHRAMKSSDSRVFYADFLTELKSLYLPDKIKDGFFGEMMEVELTNDGPVTIILETKQGQWIK